MERLKAVFAGFAPKITQQQKNINSRMLQQLDPNPTPNPTANQSSLSPNGVPPDNPQRPANPRTSPTAVAQDSLESLVGRYMSDMHHRVVLSLAEASAAKLIKKQHPKPKPTKRKSAVKSTSPEPEEQHEKLREAQRRRLELMEKLRRLDHKLDEIKKVESRVMSNGSKMESLERSLSRSRIGSNLDKHTNSQSELQKHEEAMKLIRKLNEERKEREDKKNRKAEEMMKVQQAEIEALLLAKARQAELRRQKLSRPVVHHPVNNSSRVIKGINSDSTSQLNQFSRKGSYLPTINKQNKQFEAIHHAKRLAAEKASVEVTLDPKKRSFPKGKVYHQILQQEKNFKNRQEKQLHFKQQLLNKRIQYKKNKIQLMPISMTQSLSAAPNVVTEVDGRLTDPISLKEKKSSHSDGLPVSETESKQQNIENGEVQTTQPETHTEEKKILLHEQHRNSEALDIQA